ncbi:phosphoacetylglucosamine mutase isoform X1 [Hydra vulgaris]|uniref:phosphoacetylglucosamine mutase isoform X1 n=1 Tax=Hydra vulgaris TaxID=6087 RepID=UPI001F5FD349|nr:phosphoacetylglucosamine mutase isoform X1 [Hydra vulgaris]
MSFLNKELINQSSALHPRPDFLFTYGTAGFREKGDLLDSVVFRVGMLAVLRSKHKNGQAIGVMVTASHNPVQDNGIKLVDPFGEMLEQSWEGFATELARAKDNEVAVVLSNIIEVNKINLSVVGKVVVARDTRPSSLPLVNSVKEGVKVLDGHCDDFGLLTTPQLHYIVCCINTDGSYGEPTEEGYYKKFSTAFLNLRKMICKESEPTTIMVDGANGVGAPKILEMMKYLDGTLQIQLYNDKTDDVLALNKDCGADYVKTHQNAPKGMNLIVGNRYLSFDGDADRIVYYYVNADKKFCLLDGDKIATLIAAFIKDKLNIAGVELTNGLGVVQTAYANGSSTEYLTKKLNVPVGIAKTGVKHLHHKAQEFDIGIYFEANGHGTVIFSADAREKIRNPNNGLSDKQKEAVNKLNAFMELTNQTVGDAISDMLLVESILHEKQWSCIEWDNEYQDLPNKLGKVLVKDRRILTVNHDETRLIEPKELQQKIDEIVKCWPNCRSFVRPSGTEDVVRVYVEAHTLNITERVCGLVCQAVYDMCEGVGERAVLPPLLY